MSAMAPRPFPVLPALGLAGLLVAGDALARLSYWGRARREDGLMLLDATAEASLPTWFTIATMALVGLVAWRRGADEGGWWRCTGAMFAYLAIDDAVGLHERFGQLVHGSLGGNGVYAWMLTLAPLFAVLGGLCALHLWRALHDRPRQRRWLLLGFAALGCALVGEAIEERALASPLRPRGIPLVCYTQWLEEALEVVGPVLLLGAIWPMRPSPSAPGRVRYIGIDR